MEDSNIRGLFSLHNYGSYGGLVEAQDTAVMELYLNTDIITLLFIHNNSAQITNLVQVNFNLKIQLDSFLVFFVNNTTVLQSY